MSLIRRVNRVTSGAIQRNDCECGVTIRVNRDKSPGAAAFFVIIAQAQITGIAETPMQTSRLAMLAWKHTVSAAAEAVYLRTGHDHTKPVVFYGLVNEHCNVKCRYCEYWRLKHPSRNVDRRVESVADQR